MNRVLLSALLITNGAIALTACTSNPSTSNQPSPAESPVNVSTTQPNSSFDEALYLFGNPDVKALIKQGKYKSGLDHYEKVGQTAKKPDGEEYASFFTGTNGNDIVQGFGKGEHAHFTGVEMEVVEKKAIRFRCVRPV